MDSGRASEERDTIVAAATAPGRAALAIVRLSGPATRDVLRRVFRRLRGRDVPVRRPVLGAFVDVTGQAMDEGTVVLYAAPRSATGEDVAEMTIHGSPALVRALVAACRAAGARDAQPGEFTLRALRHGKLTLDRAEAVRDLVEAATLEQARVAVRQLAGEVGGAIAPLAERTFDLLADVEAALDVAEDERDLTDSDARLAERAADLARAIDELLDSGRPAHRVRDGARVVLLGPTNAGKSSLFNRLVGSTRTIVTDEPGTTRDLVEELVVVAGLPLVLVDAAGVADAERAAALGRAETLGIARALDAAERADLVLEVYDLSRAERPAGLPAAGRLRVGTHADLPAAAPPAQGSVQVSSVTGAGLDELTRRIADALEAPGSRPLESVALASDRHRVAAAHARDAILRGREALFAGPGLDAAAAELRGALHALREILGEIGPEELLGRIFAKFCVGK